MTDQKTIRNRDTASTVRLVQQQLDELLRRTDALLDENDRYRDALTWIVSTSTLDALVFGRPRPQPLNLRQRLWSTSERC